jgi:HEAT repeat protein
VWFDVAPQRRSKVVEGLAEMAENTAELDFTSVFKLCLKDSDEAVRQNAIGGLWEFEDRSLILSLVELLKSDSSEQVRASAATALGKFSSLAQDGKLLSRDGDVVMASLMGALKDEGEWREVRRRALEAVAPFNSPDIEQYIHWAYDWEDIDLKCSSIYAMGRTGNPRWLTFLFKELQDPRPPIRYEAANACRELDQEDAAPYLIPLLQDDDFQVQLAAIGALGEIGGTLAKRALRRCLKGGDPVLEDAVRDALENIKAMEDPLAFNTEL